MRGKFREVGGVGMDVDQDPSVMLGRLQTALAGRYDIVSALGEGGMATVWLANDVRHHRRVALKILRPELAASLGPIRFRREIEIVAGLRHPHILPLYDSGESGGLLYYVMPWITGSRCVHVWTVTPPSRSPRL
jgi:serine/threonine-protein kinase